MNTKLDPNGAVCANQATTPTLAPQQQQKPSQNAIVSESPAVRGSGRGRGHVATAGQGRGKRQQHGRGRARGRVIALDASPTTLYSYVDPSMGCQMYDPTCQDSIDTDCRNDMTLEYTGQFCRYAFRQLVLN